MKKPRQRTSRKTISNSWSFWLSLVAVIVSFASLFLGGWAFWYKELRTQDKALFSLVGFDAYPIWGGNGVLEVSAFLSNQGTSPVSILRTDWVLSDVPYESDKYGRRAHYSNRFLPPLVAKGGEVMILDYLFPCVEDSCKNPSVAAEHFFVGLPDYIKHHPNIKIDLYSTFLIYCVDGNGDLREAKLDLEKFSFRGTAGTGSHSYGKMTGDMPKKTDLLQAKIIVDKFKYSSIWDPGIYSSTIRNSVAAEALNPLTPNAMKYVNMYFREIGRDTLEIDAEIVPVR